jgi:hypothetical protein
VGTGRPVADWRSAAPYALLAKCDRRAFAWEWLRRSDAYANMVDGDDVPAFGLCRFEPVDSCLPAARPIWRADTDPAVLAAVAGHIPGACSDDAFDVRALAAGSDLCVGADGTEHWLWSDGVRSIRLDVVEGTLRAGPVLLDYRIAGCASARQQADALVRLIALSRTGRIVRSLFVPEVRAARWALILRVHDALVAGASQRDIAETVLGLEDMARWRIEASSWRQRVQRLTDAARLHAGIDPRRWVDGSFP